MNVFINSVSISTVSNGYLVQLYTIDKESRATYAFESEKSLLSALPTLLNKLEV